jgi:uncharacterized damage-inducible protein DinB
MNVKESIRSNIEFADKVVQAYLGDLTDEELLIRPVEGTNHIAWQLGHLVSSEHSVIEAVAPGKMPALPEGFAEKHKKQTATSDNPADFQKKDEYLRLMKEQREGTMAALESMSDEELDKPNPDENMRPFFPKVADLFNMACTHPLMHCGQWAIIRRKTGRPPLF